MKRRKKRYWDEACESLAAEFSKTNDVRRQAVAYRKLLPKLNHMAESIAATYINFRNLSEITDIRRDAVNESLMALRTHYNPDKGRAFSFLQFVMKNHFLESQAFDRTRIKEFKKNQVYIEDLGGEDFLPCEEGMHDGNALKRILNHFEALQMKAELEQGKDSRSFKYTEKAIEFFNLYPLDPNPNVVMGSLNEYCKRELNFCDYDIVVSNKYLFHRLYQLKQRESRIEMKQRATADSHFQIIDDDFTPDNSQTYKSYKKRIRREVSGDMTYKYY